MWTTIKAIIKWIFQFGTNKKNLEALKAGLFVADLAAKKFNNEQLNKNVRFVADKVDKAIEGLSQKDTKEFVEELNKNNKQMKGWTFGVGTSGVSIEVAGSKFSYNHKDKSISTLFKSL